jgi:hypothetical protein
VKGGILGHVGNIFISDLSPLTRVTRRSKYWWLCSRCKASTLRLAKDDFVPSGQRLRGPLQGSLGYVQTNVFGLASGSSFGMTCFPSASIPLMISSCLS